MNIRIISFLTILLLLAGCASPAAKSQSGTPWPTKDWSTSTPAEQGMDQAMLDKMLVHIDENYLDLHGLLVIRHGSIVFEKYYPRHDRNELHEVYSVTKSVTSTLYGIAVNQGKLKGVDIPVKDFFPLDTYDNPDPRKETMTMENLLTMSSGLDWVQGEQSDSMQMSDDWVKYVLSLPQVAQPGKVFTYSDGCSQVILQVVEKAVGKDVVDFAKENLFQPLGIRDFTWERNSKGEAIGGWGLSLTARDMAKLGYLFLHNGEWDGKQVVSRAWVEKATGNRMKTGVIYQTLDMATTGGSTRPILPTQRLATTGRRIFVIPDLDMVVVTTGSIIETDLLFQLIDNYIIPAASE